MRHVSLLLGLCLSLLLGGCGGDTGPSGAPAAATAPSAPQEAVTRIGDVTIRASVVQTSTLPEPVAMQYGIARSDRQALLLVAVRQGPEAQETSLPAAITATAHSAEQFWACGSIESSHVPRR